VSAIPSIPTPDQPQLADFQAFVQSAAGISPNYLPLDSPQYIHAFDEARNIVNYALHAAWYYRTSWSPYSLAVLNLGTHLLIEYALDVSWAIQAASWTNGLVTITTTAANTIQAGDRVAIAGISPYAYDNAPIDPGSQTAAWIVNAIVDAQNFNYALQPNPGTASLPPTSAIGGFSIGQSAVAGYIVGASVTQQYFTIARARLGINQFSPGVITSTSDLTTSAGLLNPKFMQNLTLENLQLLKTSFGRAYLGIAMKYGPTVWGLSQ
jgi:hypothetical protein